MKTEKKKTQITGDIGEILISDFFTKNFTKIYSFPNPKASDKAEIADILIWLNRTAILLEVKTRDEKKASASMESWARSRIKNGYDQICKHYPRITRNEKILLKNDYYNAQLDCRELTKTFGLIILVSEDKCSVEPTQYLPEIYDALIPIHVIMWNDLQNVIEEIDTVPDLVYYLQDRFEYLKHSDIPTGTELDVLGYYKAHSNKFPTNKFDFTNQWEMYKNDKKKDISKRNLHNNHSLFIEKLTDEFTSQRKLSDGIPVGLYPAWELGSLSRREMAYIGEKISEVPKWFAEGNTSRQFCFQSGSTQNWMLFYFYKSSDSIQNNELKRLCELKLIKERYINNFNYGLYGFSFRVSDKYPYDLICVDQVIPMGVEMIDSIYNKETIAQAIKEFGDNGSYYKKKIKEFLD